MRSTMTGARDERAVIAAASAVRSQQRRSASRYEPGCEKASVTCRKVDMLALAVRRATNAAFIASCVSCQHSSKSVVHMTSASAWPCRAPTCAFRYEARKAHAFAQSMDMRERARPSAPAVDRTPRHERAQARVPLRALNADLSRPPSSAATARTPNSPPAPANVPRARSPDAGSHAAPAARSTTCRYAGACGPPRPT